MTKTALRGEAVKDDFIYARIEKELIGKVDLMVETKKFKNRSQAIRSILTWSFENGIEQLDVNSRPRRNKEEGPLTEDIIYTRLENQLLTQVDMFQTKCQIKTRSETVRGVLFWAFQNGVDQA